MTFSTKQPELDPKAKTVKYLERLGRINHLVGITGVQTLRRQIAQQNKNKEAEEAFVRKQVWGYDEPKQEDEMGDQIYLGDIRESHYHQQTNDKSGSIAKTLAATGLALSGLGVGTALPIAAWNLTRPETPVVQPQEPSADTNTQYGLRIFRSDESPNDR